MEVLFDGASIAVASGQTLLSALTASGNHIPHNCCAGACQSCLMRAVEGTPPAASQEGLKDSLKAQNYFLACICKPESPLTVELAPRQNRLMAKVVGHRLFNASVLQLRLKPDEPFDYYPGQYITLFNEDEIGRSYSLASVPVLDDFIEVQIHLLNNGVVSRWLHQDVGIGSSISFQGPMGDCFYMPGASEQKLLLAGTGTGLSPLVGIARDALQQGHRGEVHLVHGALCGEGLYLHQPLLQLEEAHQNFYYHASLLHPAPVDASLKKWTKTAVDALCRQLVPKPQGWKIYLAGNPDLVNGLRRTLFLAGASNRDIYADPFTTPPAEGAS